GSAGVQPAKEYPGRRCAEGASGLQRITFGGLCFFALRTFGHRSYASENSPAQCLSRHGSPSVPSRLAPVTTTSFSRAIPVLDEKGRPCTYWGLSSPRSMKIVERSKLRRVHSRSKGLCRSRSKPPVGTPPQLKSNIRLPRHLALTNRGRSHAHPI